MQHCFVRANRKGNSWRKINARGVARTGIVVYEPQERVSRNWSAKERVVPRKHVTLIHGCFRNHSDEGRYCIARDSLRRYTVLRSLVCSQEMRTISLLNNDGHGEN